VGLAGISSIGNYKIITCANGDTHIEEEKIFSPQFQQFYIITVCMQFLPAEASFCNANKFNANFN